MIFEGGLFELVLFDACRGAQSCQVEPVDRIHHLVETPSILLLLGGTGLGGLEDQIDGGVEFPPRVGHVVRLVQAFAALKTLLGADDQGIPIGFSKRKLGVGKQEGRDVVQIDVRLYRGWRGDLRCRQISGFGRSRQERCLEPRLLVVTAGSGKEGYGE